MIAKERLAVRAAGVLGISLILGAGWVGAGAPARGDTLYVGEGVPGGYETITEAIANASDGDTILVYPGFYPENLELDRSVVLEAEGSGPVVIDGGGFQDVVRITAPQVRVTGFTIQNGGSGSEFLRGGIHATSSAAGVSITDNVLHSNSAGIVLVSLDGGEVLRNSASNNVWGIRVEGCTGVTVRENSLRWNTVYGIWLRASSGCTVAENDAFSSADAGLALTSSSDGNLVIGNALSFGGVGLRIQGAINEISGNMLTRNERGVYVEAGSSGNRILGNVVSDNTGEGIFLDGTSGEVSQGNTIERNGTGIWLVGPGQSVTGNVVSRNEGDGVRVSFSSTGNVISGNTEIASNGESGILLDGTTDQRVENNQLVGNGIVIGGEEASHWDSHTIEGNLANGGEIRYLKGLQDVTVAPGASQVIVAGCTNVTVEDLALNDVDVGLALGFSSGISIAGVDARGNDTGIVAVHCDQVALDAATMIGNRDDGFVASSCTDVTLGACTVLQNGKAGIRIADASGALLTGCTVSGNLGLGIHLQGAGAGVRIEGCTVTDNGSIGIHADTAVADLVVSECVVSANDDGLLLKGMTGGEVRDNVIRSNRLYGLKLTSCAGVSVGGNTITDNRFYFGIRLCGDANTVTGNTLSGNRSGILLCGSGNVLTSNAVRAHSLDGILIRYDADNNTLAQNTIEDNAGHGIVLESGWNLLSENLVRRNGLEGILAAAREGKSRRPRSNVIAGNDISYNRGVGLRFDATCRWNRVYHNTFRMRSGPAGVRRAWCAFDDGDNRWDDGPASGGNFWSDYTGVDGDGDGMGDTPRPIPGAVLRAGIQRNRDRHPLIAPPSR